MVAPKARSSARRVDRHAPRAAQLVSPAWRSSSRSHRSEVLARAPHGGIDALRLRHTSAAAVMWHVKRPPTGPEPANHCACSTTCCSDESSSSPPGPSLLAPRRRGGRASHQTTAHPRNHETDSRVAVLRARPPDRTPRRHVAIYGGVLLDTALIAAVREAPAAPATTVIGPTGCDCGPDAPPTPASA
jgi:hypothetical protein